MKLRISSEQLSDQTPGLLVLLYEGTTPMFNLPAKAFKTLQGREQFEALTGDQEVWSFRSGQQAVLYLSTSQVKYFTREEKLKTLASRALKAAAKYKLSAIQVPLSITEMLAPLAEGFLISAYKFDKYKSAKKERPTPEVTFSVPGGDAKALTRTLARAQVIAEGVNFARDLVNEPAEAIYPETLAQAATEMAKKVGLEVQVLDEKALAKGKFGGVLGVGKGAARPPRLIVLRYRPKARGGVHLGLVGKAVAFDTGGISIKPSSKLWEMKSDMAGGAAVLGAMMTIARLKPDIRITAVVPSVINAVGPLAILPGDIIASRSGKTVHVDNTDAEGRLILMDALDYVQDEGATHVVDAATLTGSIVRALGTSYTGAFANDQALVNRLISVGKEVGEEIWQMPLADEYRQQLDHPIADMDNVGKGPNGGSITAALFLREFIRDGSRWVHLDIAGTSMADKAWKYFAPGATGVGVRTFAALAESLAAEGANIKKG